MRKSLDPLDMLGRSERAERVTRLLEECGCFGTAPACLGEPGEVHALRTVLSQHGITVTASAGPTSGGAAATSAARR